MEVHGPDSIKLQDVLDGRRNRESFHWFLDEVASVVVGTLVYDQVKCVKLPSEWITPSLEAFSILCLENYYEMIKSEVNKEEKKSRAKWTSEGRGSRKFQGWNQDGIRRYNVLMERVRLDRRSFQQEDEIYLHSKQEERMRYENDRLKKRQADADNRDTGLQAAHDDFSSDSESDSG